MILAVDEAIPYWEEAFCRLGEVRPFSGRNLKKDEIRDADALIVRPLGICATILGVGLFVISLPFSALGGNVKEAGKKLVVAPAKFTFQRPLGEF